MACVTGAGLAILDSPERRALLIELIDKIEKASRGRGKRRLVAPAIGLGFTFGRRIKAIRDQIQKHPRDILREHIGLASGRIK